MPLLSDLLEDLERSPHAAAIAECFVERVSTYSCVCVCVLADRKHDTMSPKHSVNYQQNWSHHSVQNTHTAAVDQTTQWTHFDGVCVCVHAYICLHVNAVKS